MGDRYLARFPSTIYLLLNCSPDGLTLIFVLHKHDEAPPTEKENVMDIGAIGGVNPSLQNKRPEGLTGPMPPSADEVANQISDDLDSGRIDAEEIQARLVERFGDDAEGLINDDGSLDVEKLTSLMEEQRASGKAPPPPPSSGQTEEEIATLESNQQALDALTGDEEEGISDFLQQALDALTGEEEETSLVEQLYGAAANQDIDTKELFSIVV